MNDLLAKGIDRDTAADVVEELFAETDDGESPELETARALVQRQYAAKLARPVSATRSPPPSPAADFPMR